MNWEVYPESVYNVLKNTATIKICHRLMVTENGAALY